VESEHLTDAEIQDYLDGNVDRDESTLGAHLDSCSLCKKNLELYRCLYSGLSDDDGYELSVDFADKVVSSVGLGDSRSLFPRYANVLVSIIGIVAAIGALYYFTDMPKIIAGGAWLGWFDSILKGRIYASMAGYASSAGNTVSLIISGALALVTIWAVDRFMIRSKRRPSSLVI
jgi:hypothetical protein